MKKLKLLFISALLFHPAQILAQTESKLAWLDSVPPAEREARLLEAAKKEGQVVAYANLDVSGAKALADGFMRKYPALKLQMVHFSGAAIITRIDTEARAGKVSADAVLSGQLGMLGLLDKKFAARYRSPQRDFYPEGFKDREGLWTAMFTNLMVTSYNTRFVKKEEAPRKIEDLLQPRWKDKLAMDTQSYVWFGTMLQFLGEEPGLRFMKRLNEQNPTHIRGRRHMNELLAAGEFDMAVETNLNSVLTLSKLGAPLWFAPIRPLFLSPSLLFMNQNAPHPNAAAFDRLLPLRGRPTHHRAGQPDARDDQGEGCRKPNRGRSGHPHAGRVGYRNPLQRARQDVPRSLSRIEVTRSK